MELSNDFRENFTERVRVGVRDLIDLNDLDDLEDFDAGLYITNIFDRVLKSEFDFSSMSESTQRYVRSFLWSHAYSDLEVKRYENYIETRKN